MEVNLKDYYKTLGIPSSASAQQIKAAYRRLAMRYHPDTNPDNQYAAKLFRELHEAYSVLSIPATRQRYDEERWLNGLDNRTRNQLEITPAWLMAESKKLRRYMEVIDTYRMSHKALRDYTLHLLSDEHMAVLLHHNDHIVNKNITEEILAATKAIEHRYMSDIAARLFQLVEHDQQMAHNISIALQRKKEQNTWQQYKPLAILLLSLLIAFAMYLWGRR